MHVNRYAFLDGVRGIAALFVLARHTVNFWDFSLYRSYLAVDLFFILSGFVISFAYDEKLKNGRVSIKDFFIIRAIRLYPVFFISLVFSILIFLLKIISKHQLEHFDWIEFLAVTALSALLLPSRMDSTNGLFPINGLYWSLFFEITANLIYAVIRPLLSSRILVLIILASAVVFSAGAFSNGNLDIGFNWGLISIASGFSRAMFGIFFGLLLHRHLEDFSRKIFRASPWLAVLIVVLILASPSAGKNDPLVDILMVVIVFPICVLWAAQGSTSNSKANNLLLTLGSASYPIYVLHKPAGELVSAMLKGVPINLAPVSGIVFVLVLIAASIGLEKKFDIPLRRRLSAWLLPARR